MLIDFVVLRYGVVVVADKQLNGPDNKGEEDIHPSPPNL